MNDWRLTLCKGLRCGVLVAVLRTSVTAQVAGTTSTTALSVNASSLVLPGSVTLTSTVNPLPLSAVPTGTVNFSYDNGIALGSAALKTLTSSQAFPALPSGTAAIQSLNSTPALPAALVAFDFYGTGTPVIVAANSGNPQTSTVSTISVFANPGSSALGQGAPGTVIVSAGFENPIDQIAAGFFLDPTTQSLLVHRRDAYSLYGTSGPGLISFGPTSTAGFVSDTDLETVSIGDFDGDGYSDVGVLITNQNSVGFAMNAGSKTPGVIGAFSQVTLPTTAPDGTVGRFCPAAITTGKFATTLNTQLAVLGFFVNGQSICPTLPALPPANTPSYVALYTATAAATAVTAVGSLSAVGLDQTSLAAADFNHDGNLDLLVGSSADNNLQVLSGDGAGGFQAAATIATPATPSQLTVNDFNGDGYPDVAIQVAGGVAISLNDGKGNLQTPTQPYASGTLQSLSSADFNGDGLADVALLEPASAAAPSGTAQSLLSSASAQAVFTTLPQTLPAGSHTLTAAYAGDKNFAASISTPFSEAVTQTVPVLSWPAPDPVMYSSPAPTLGAQLDATATIAGAVLPGVYAYSPAAGSALTLGANSLTVTFTPTDAFDYATAMATVTEQVNLPAASATATLSTANSSGGAQPTINLNLGSFPQPVEVTITLGFTDSSASPAADNGSLMFTTPASPFPGEVITPSSAGVFATDAFTVPANSSTGQLQRVFSAGTVAGAVSVTITIKDNGTNITPSSLAPLPLPIPASVPALDTATYSLSGSTLTVVVNASSSTREISGAAFHFTPASGQTLKTTDVNLPSPTEFSQWFTGQPSAASGGSFTYTQTFTLSSANAVGGVTVTLQNGQGQSTPITAQNSD